MSTFILKKELSIRDVETKLQSMEFINYTAYKQYEDIKRLKYIVDAAKQYPKKIMKILDIGCGNGHISYQLAKYGHDVTGVDLSLNAIEQARNKYQLPNLNFKNISAEELKDGIGYFDMIICSEVLEHLHNPGNVLKEIYQLMDTDGILIVTIPNGYGPRERLITRPVQKLSQSNNPLWRIIKSVKKSLGYTGTTTQSAASDLTHIQFFKLKTFRHLAEENNFNIIQIGASNFIEKVFPFSILTRLAVPLQQFDCWVADHIPVTWSSGFIIKLEKSPALSV